MLAHSGYFQLLILAWHVFVFFIRDKALRSISGVLGGNESVSLSVCCGSGRKGKNGGEQRCEAGLVIHLRDNSEVEVFLMSQITVM